MRQGMAVCRSARMGQPQDWLPGGTSGPCQFERTAWHSNAVQQNVTLAGQTHQGMHLQTLRG